MSTLPCPHCGAEIDADATFCRHCGSSDTDGWSEEFDTDTDDDFDYDSYVEQHHSSSVTNQNVSPLWRAVAVVLLLCFLAWAFLAF